MADNVSVYPDVWQDDEQMSVMFSHFRQSRELNPRSWDSKMLFWITLIRDECTRCGDVVLDAATFHRRFIRKSQTPKCLGKVFHEMLKRNYIVSVDDFMKEANQTALTWAFDRLVVTPIRWSWQSFLGGESTEEITEGRFIVWSAVQSLSEQIEDAHHLTVKNPLTDHVVEVTEVRKQCDMFVKDEETLKLTLMWLKKQGRVQLILDRASEVRAVKFARRDQTTVEPVNEFDHKVLKLKQTESELEAELDKNHVEMERCLIEAKRYVRDGHKTHARAALRVKKKCESQIQKRSQALCNVQDILSKIRDSHADRMVVEAYEAGAEALRASNKLAPPVSAVDDIMSELELLYEEDAEVKASLQLGGAAEADVSLSELEAELAELTDSDRINVPAKAPVLPAVPVSGLGSVDMDSDDQHDSLLAALPDPPVSLVAPSSGDERRRGVMADT